MQTLSKGWKKPETGDFGDIWFPAMEDNIDQMNSHNHDGIDSEKIDISSVQKLTQTVLNTDFVDQGDGYHRALVTVPGGFLVDDFTIVLKDPTTKDQIHAKIEKVSGVTFYIYTNTVQNFEVYYGK